jgi:hypothetical protein
LFADMEILKHDYEGYEVFWREVAKTVI